MVADRQAAGEQDKVFPRLCGQGDRRKAAGREGGEDRVSKVNLELWALVPIVRPGSGSGADRWFEIKSKIHHKLLNSLNPGAA